MRSFMKMVALLAATLVAAGLSVPPAGSQEAPEERPNILVIVTDDQRPGDTVAVMPRTTKTFIGGGTYFPKAIATTPVCCPSRASIFTGRYAHNHNVRSNAGDEAQGLDQSTTVQSYLERAGYRTGLVGKYLNGWDLTQPPPHFDEYAVTGGGYYNNRFMVGSHGSARILRSPGYSTRFVGRKTEEFLRNSERTDDQPWLLYVTPFAPHSPSIAPIRYKNAKVPPFQPTPAMLEADLSDKPPQYLEYAKPFNRTAQARRRKKQLRALMPVDDLVARVFNLLRKSEETNTLAVFMSDNGYLWGEHGLSAKATPYSFSTGIPLMLRWKDRIARGIVDDRLAANIDVAPTVLAAAGVEPSHRVDGRSLLDSWDREALLAEVYGAISRPELRWASILSHEYQYVEYYGSDETVPTFHEYYDLVQDPWQLDNLFADGDTSNDPDVTELTLRLSQYRTCPMIAPCP
jgi:arylsulfatase A-like enzyme